MKTKIINMLYNKPPFFKSTVRILLLFLIIIPLYYCGQKNALLIKPNPVPQNPSSVESFQRGQKLYLILEYPQKLKNDDPLDSLDSIKVKGYFKKDDPKDITETESKKQEKIKQKIFFEKTDIKFDNSDKKITATIDLPEEKGTVLFKIITEHKDFTSKSSINEFNFIKTEPPPTIENVTINDSENVFLKWKAENTYPYFNIYKNETEKPYKTINGIYDEFTDEINQDNQGKEIKYCLTGILKKSPLIESKLSDCKIINVTDTTPPPEVENIRYLFTNETDIIIRWDKVKAKDMLGYNIYISSKTEKDFDKHNKEIHKENEFSLTNLRKGNTYLVYICSIDSSGNESKKSKIIKIKL